MPKEAGDRPSAIDTSNIKALSDDRQPGMAGEGAAIGKEFDVGHENGLGKVVIGYFTIQLVT